MVLFVVLALTMPDSDEGGNPRMDKFNLPWIVAEIKLVPSPPKELPDDKRPNPPTEPHPSEVFTNEEFPNIACKSRQYKAN